MTYVDASMSATRNFGTVFRIATRFLFHWLGYFEAIKWFQESSRYDSKVLSVSVSVWGCRGGSSEGVETGRGRKEKNSIISLDVGDAEGVRGLRSPAEERCCMSVQG